MLQFLEDLKGTGKAPISSMEREELEKLRKEHVKLRAKYEDKKTSSKNVGKAGHNSESDESSDEVCD